MQSGPFLLDEEVDILEWNSSKRPSHPKYRTEAAADLREVRRSIFAAGLNTEELREALGFVRLVHHEAITEMIAAENTIRKIVAKRQWAFELWRASKEGGVQ